MKRFMILGCIACTFSLPTSYAFSKTIRLSNPVTKDSTTETFGSFLDSSLPNTSLAKLLTRPDENLGAPFILETRISKVCQRKGCFFIAQQDKHVVRVSFKDYGFFIPTDSSGKVVLLAGELVKKQLSEEQASHFSKDLNSDTQTVKQGDVYEIVASSIKIPLR